MQSSFQESFIWKNQYFEPDFYIDLQIKKEFVEKIEKFYVSTIQNVDFTHPDEAIEIINQFVNNQTNGIIPTLFEQGTLDALSKLVLVNAIYFKGQWKFPFDVEKTKPMNFTIDEVKSFFWLVI